MQISVRYNKMLLTNHIVGCYMKIVLLPGLDGTGLLLSRFVEALSENYSTQVIRYPSNELLQYHELADLVLKQLPHEDFILLAESFSGPIAYLVAQTKPKNLKSLIFVATFLAPPRKNLLKFSAWLPMPVLLSLPIPNFFIRNFLLGHDIDELTIKLFKKSLKDATAKTLAYRLQQINQLNLKLTPIQYPVIYLQANQDFLVQKDSLGLFKKYCKQLKILNIDSQHFVLQTQPERCAKMLVDEINHSTQHTNI